MKGDYIQLEFFIRNRSKWNRIEKYRWNLRSFVKTRKKKVISFSPMILHIPIRLHTIKNVFIIGSVRADKHIINRKLFF